MSVIIDSARQAWDKLINFLLRDDRLLNLQAQLQASAKWQPNGEFFDYKEEMQNREDYWSENMGSDMKVVLKRHFPQTYKDFEKDQINLPLVKKEVKDKAQVFGESGDVELVDEKGKPVEAAKKIFEKIKRESCLWSALKLADVFTQLHHRTMLKFWWDTRTKQIQCSVWPAQLVDIVPDPKRWWDVDASRAVLFTLPGLDGNQSTNKRYEIWGLRDPEAVKLGMPNTVHFTTDGDNDTHFNEGDHNPFTNPRTKEPMLPFVWFRDDKSTDLYKLGNTDMLGVNRHVNSSVTDMFYGMRYSRHPVYVHVMAEGGTELGVKTLSPGTVVDIPFGATLTTMTPDLNVSEQWEVIKEVMEVRALFGGLSPTAVRADSSAPESGYAVKIRNKPIAEHRNNLIEIYRPYVEEAVFRFCVVHNTYSKDKIPGLEKLRAKWTPGDIDEIEDPSATATQYAAEIEKDVSTPVDWRATRYDETKEEAEQAVRDNAELNKELNEAGRSESPFEKAARFSTFGETDTAGKPVEPEEGEEEPPARAGAQAGEGEPKDKKTTPPKKPTPKSFKKLPEPSQEEKEEVEKSDLKLNVYQMALAIDRGAATPVDLRMMLFPEESEAEATAAVKKSIAFNNQLAALLAKAKAIEAKALGGKKKKGKDLEA